MQPTFPLSVLLASISFVVLSSVRGTQAAPIRMLTRSVSLPLAPIPKKSGVHPQVLLQQRINRSLKRHARATGRSLPSNEELERHLNKRLVSLEEQGVTHFSKRHNRPNTFDGLEGITIFEDGGFVSNGIQGEGREEIPTLADGTQGEGREESRDSAGDNAGGDTGGGVPDVTVAKEPTTAKSLGINIEGHDTGYFATIQIGTPPRDFLILMDSGSADFWVGSENCRSEAGGDCGNHKFLGPESSSTFKDTGASFQVPYGSGEVEGTVVQDNLIVAGLNLPGHTFGVANLESPDFTSLHTPFDGLMGLAQSSLSEQKTATPIEVLAEKGLINQAVTSYKIPRLADGKKDGQITFGAIDPTKFKSNTLVTLPNVSNRGFWEVDMPGVVVNGEDIGLRKRTAILDTGTTLVLAPMKDAKAVHAAIPGARTDGQGGFTVPCDTQAKVSLKFGKSSFTIDTRDLVLGPVDSENRDCVSGIASGKLDGAKEWLLGDVFLKNAYFSTNTDKNHIQFAQLV